MFTSLPDDQKEELKKWVRQEVEAGLGRWFDARGPELYGKAAVVADKAARAAFNEQAEIFEKKWKLGMSPDTTFKKVVRYGGMAAIGGVVVAAATLIFGHKNCVSKEEYDRLLAEGGEVEEGGGKVLRMPRERKAA